jgi:hypothetical protein
MKEGQHMHFLNIVEKKNTSKVGDIAECASFWVQPNLRWKVT